MHVLLVFERFLVQNFVVFLLSVQTISKATIVINLRHHIVLVIRGADKLITNLDFVTAALIQQFQVLPVAHHSFFTFLKAFPLFVLNHGGICVHVLTLELLFLEFFRETSILFRLNPFLSANIVVSFSETFLTSRNSCILTDLSITSLLVPSIVSLLLAFNTSLFDLGGIFN